MANKDEGIASHPTLRQLQEVILISLDDEIYYLYITILLVIDCPAICRNTLDCFHDSAMRFYAVLKLNLPLRKKSVQDYLKISRLYFITLPSQTFCFIQNTSESLKCFSRVVYWFVIWD